MTINIKIRKYNFLKKLDMRGISHDVVVIAFVVVFAIAGTAYLVASHADTCTPVSAPTSIGSGGFGTNVYLPGAEGGSSVSGPNCSPVSSPVSIPTLTAKCSTTGVPANPQYNQTIQPVLTITNTGNQSFSPHIQNTFVTFNAQGVPAKSSQLQTLPDLKPGQTYQEQLPQSSVPYAPNNTARGVYTTASIVNSNIPGARFSCGATFNLPPKP